MIQFFHVVKTFNVPSMDSIQHLHNKYARNVVIRSNLRYGDVRDAHHGFDQINGCYDGPFLDVLGATKLDGGCGIFLEIRNQHCYRMGKLNMGSLVSSIRNIRLDDDECHGNHHNHRLHNQHRIRYRSPNLHNLNDHNQLHPSFHRNLGDRIHHIQHLDIHHHVLRVLGSW